MNLKKQKKAVSSIIVTVLLILIVIIAIAVVAVFVMKMVRDNTQEIATPSISITQSSAKYNPKEVLLFVAVERGSDNANLSKIMFIITSSAGSKTFINNMTPETGEKLYYNIMPESSDIKKLEIAPIVRLNNGKEKTLPVTDSANINTLSDGCDLCRETDDGWIKFSDTPIEINPGNPNT